MDVSDKMVATKRGPGAGLHGFDLSSPEPGVYFLNLPLGGASARIRR